MPGSIIVSDTSWFEDTISRIGGGMYEHQVAAPSDSYADSVGKDACTQSMDKIRMRAKRLLKKHFGTSEGLFETYMHEFIYRNQFSNLNFFAEFLISVSEQYPVSWK